MEALIPIIRDLGFPVFVAVFLLIRIEPTIKRLDITCAKILQFMENHHTPP